MSETWGARCQWGSLSSPPFILSRLRPSHLLTASRSDPLVPRLTHARATHAHSGPLVLRLTHS
eukprot:6466085-Pyramimonas_sp.AAC.1